MLKRKYNKPPHLIATLLFSSGLIVATSALSAVSCSQQTGTPSVSNDNHEVKKLKNVYDDWVKKNINTNRYYVLTKEKSELWSKYIEEFIPKINDLLTNYNLDTDGKIWAESFMYDLKIKKALLDSKYYLLIPTSGDQLSMTQYSKNMANVLLAPVRAKEDQILDSIHGVSKYIDQVTSILKEALSMDVTYSGVQAKHGIGYIYKSLFSKELSLSANNEPIGAHVSTYDSIKDKYPQEVAALTIKLEDFIRFLSNEYYPSIKFGRSDPIGTSFKVEKSTTPKDIEEQATIVGKDGKTYYFNGLGLNPTDLSTKDIGIGFMKDQGAPIGKAIYNALLMKHSTTNKTASEIYKLGIENVESIITAMEATGNAIADEIVGKGQAWTAEEFYDADSSGTEFGSKKVTLPIRDSSGNFNLKNFFIWLNTDRWFNGRDMTENQYATIDPVSKTPLKKDTNTSGKTPYLVDLNYVSKDPSITSINIGKIIGSPDYDGSKGATNTPVYGDAGNLYFKYITHNYSPAYDISGGSLNGKYSSSAPSIEQTPNSISTEAAYIGSAAAVRQYLEFKEATAKHYIAPFYKTSFDYTLRTGTGGAAYASSGTGGSYWKDDAWGGFYLDVNPYFGLQKWSMSTLSVHEAITGHVFQFNYKVDHPASEDIVYFNYTSYAEGWGLFSEWLAVQMGGYGEPNVISPDQNNPLALPKFGVNSKTVNVEQYTNKYDYANGAYWVDRLNKNSQVLFDATQYFGFLNERQLRAMRMSVDTAIHSGGGIINSEGIVSDNSNAGLFKPGTGWSLNDARAYMQANSGLGLDDIKRESKRYLNYTGQAVSYFNGLLAIQNAWIEANNKYVSNFNKVFIDYNNTASTNSNTAGLLDLILRNGSIPLDVLTKYTNEYIKNNYNK